jgi:hypothetical protein
MALLHWVISIVQSEVLSCIYEEICDNLMLDMTFFLYTVFGSIWGILRYILFWMLCWKVALLLYVILMRTQTLSIRRAFTLKACLSIKLLKWLISEIISHKNSLKIYSYINLSKKVLSNLILRVQFYALSLTPVKLKWIFN